MSSTTSTKAFAFGIGATLAIVLGTLQVEQQAAHARSVVTLDPVIINIKREKPQQLPTVYITGKRATQGADGQQLAALSRASCPTNQVC